MVIPALPILFIRNSKSLSRSSSPIDVHLGILARRMSHGSLAKKDRNILLFPVSIVEVEKLV